MKKLRVQTYNVKELIEKINIQAFSYCPDNTTCETYFKAGLGCEPHAIPGCGLVGESGCTNLSNAVA